jgi:hypothetical protein
MRCVPLSLRHVCTYFLVLKKSCGNKKSIKFLFYF